MIKRQKTSEHIKIFLNTIYDVFTSEELNAILKDIDFIETFEENSLWNIE